MFTMKTATTTMMMLVLARCDANHANDTDTDTCATCEADLDTFMDGTPWSHLKNLVFVKGELAAHRRADAVQQLTCEGECKDEWQPHTVHCKARSSSPS